MPERSLTAIFGVIEDGDIYEIAEVCLRKLTFVDALGFDR